MSPDVTLFDFLNVLFLTIQHLLPQSLPSSSKPWTSQGGIDENKTKNSYEDLFSRLLEAV